MSVYQYHTEQSLPIPSSEAWDFFSSPMNLARITPPEMGFKVLSESELSTIYSGMRIRYVVKPLFGIPLIWETLIKDVSAPVTFTDVQLKGPYSSWEHTHTFLSTEDGVLMKDSLRYKLPLGVLGDIAHLLFVRRKIVEIFDYRKRMLNKFFQ